MKFSEVNGAENLAVREGNLYFLNYISACVPLLGNAHTYRMKLDGSAITQID